MRNKCNKDINIKNTINRIFPLKTEILETKWMRKISLFLKYLEDKEGHSRSLR